VNATAGATPWDIDVQPGAPTETGASPPLATRRVADLFPLADAGEDWFAACPAAAGDSAECRPRQDRGAGSEPFAAGSRPRRGPGGGASCTAARSAGRGKPRKSGPSRAARALLPSSDDGDRLLDVHEAAEMLGLQPRTLYQWAYQRRIPRVKLSGPRGPLRFRLSDIRDVIARSAQPALRESGRDQSQWGRLS